MDIFASGSLILIFFSDWMDTGLTYVRVRIVNVLLVSYVRPMLYYLSRFEFDFDFRQSWFLTLIHEFLWIEKKKLWIEWFTFFKMNGELNWLIVFWNKLGMWIHSPKSNWVVIFFSSRQESDKRETRNSFFEKFLVSSSRKFLVA